MLPQHLWPEVTLTQMMSLSIAQFNFKYKVYGLNKAKLEELLFTLMDECDSINSENCMLKDACSELKRDIRELEHENKILKSEMLTRRPLLCMKTSINLGHLKYERRSICY